MAYDISVLEFIGVSIISVWYLDLYCVTLCMCSIAFSLPSLRSKSHVKRQCRYSMMETKEPDFVSTMSRTIKCNHCSKLLVNQQGLFYTVKKTKGNCIVFTGASTHKIISILFKTLSLGFILKIILKISQISASIFL